MSEESKFLKDRGNRFRDARIKKGWSFKELARKANRSEKTIRNLESGSVRSGERTVSVTASALGLASEEVNQFQADLVPLAQYGVYSKFEVSEYEGYYASYRRAASQSGLIFRSFFRFRWSEDNKGLHFAEYQKYQFEGRNQDYCQDGMVYNSPNIDTIQLLSNHKHDLRLITLKKFRTGDNFAVECLRNGRRGRIICPCAGPLF